MASVAENRAKSIFDSVLKEIKPTKSDINATTASVNILMNRLAKITGKGIELRVAGSIAKGTNLRGDADMDIFMLFKKGTGKELMEKKAIEYGKKLASGKSDRYLVKYAEHPYVRLYMGSMGINADLVPATKIDNPEELATTVDRTPFHTEFILSNMTEKQKDDTRVLKYLLKAHDIYGAEVKVSGLSGYLCELLICNFGSLYKLLEYMSRSNLPIILLPKSKKEGDIEYAKRFKSDFVVIDPVDSSRNVAAGVSVESLSRFILASKMFIAKPSKGMFYAKKVSVNEHGKLLQSLIKESSLDIHVIAVKTGETSEDIVWPQLRKSANMIINRAAQLGFRIYLHSESVTGTNGIIALVAPRESVGSRIIKGPKADMGNAPLKFIAAHKEALGFIVEDCNVNAVEKSECKTLHDLLAEVSKGKQVITKKGIKLKGAKVYANSEIPAQYSYQAYCGIAKKLRI